MFAPRPLTSSGFLDIWLAGTCGIGPACLSCVPTLCLTRFRPFLAFLPSLDQFALLEQTIIENSEESDLLLGRIGCLMTKPSGVTFAPRQIARRMDKPQDLYDQLEGLLEGGRLLSGLVKSIATCAKA